ncbi:hypothetical protein L5515_009830 [Caenorhabditis briggsae]|uniref:Uncharacterized protein n=1 Tax=Caenorhabditis briggsae TaxID=6238 RepID=A0AAE9D291_CAEBR|nr:hypothetical protein L3Y34_010032 [Caenorhabditis briggsae]UMM38400.1 hypothetical protein L5515_009830 [Caenorhabditis briggsae]
MPSENRRRPLPDSKDLSVATHRISHKISHPVLRRKFATLMPLISKSTAPHLPLVHSTSASRCQPASKASSISHRQNLHKCSLHFSQDVDTESGSSSCAQWKMEVKSHTPNTPAILTASEVSSSTSSRIWKSV